MYIGDINISRYASPADDNEGWIDNFWAGPADQFNPTLTGNEVEVSTYGNYSNDTKVADPINVATGNFTYTNNDISVNGTIPLEFTRNYKSKEKMWRANFTENEITINGSKTELRNVHVDILD